MGPFRLSPWLRLLRIAALPSALSNILLGFLLAQGSWEPATWLCLLMIASACFYLSGMVLNDVFDAEVDRKNRPSRPIPSGEISRSAASFTGLGLLVAGLLISLFIAVQAKTSIPTWIGMLLAISIILYNGPLKRTPISPLVMGLCRSLNILLGASIAGATIGSPKIPLTAWWFAVCIGVLITGTTWLAKREDRESQPSELLPAAIVIGAGLLLYFFTCCIRSFDLADRPRRTFPILFLLISFPIIRRTLSAVFRGTPAAVQSAVGTIIRSLIILDAAAVWLVADDQIFYPIVVLALLVPALLLGRVSKVT